MGKKEFAQKKPKREKRVVTPLRENTDTQLPIWRFDKLDKGGTFAFELSRGDFRHQDVLEKLMN